LRAQARQAVGAPHEFVALRHVLDDMRLYKSRAEQASLRRAAQISVGAHRRAMRFARPGRMEYEVMAELLHEFRSHNADLSYYPIVGSGANTCVMHYRDNDQPLHDGDLLLLDAGCEHELYASDITRTFPVSGRFTPSQRAIYDIVLEAQLAAIDKVRAGNHWNHPHEAAVRVITQGLVRLGLLKGKLAALIKSQAYLPFFSHRTGHWLGLDVHDVGDYKVGGEWRVLEPGMVLTVEPGIYIRPAPRIPGEFWNIGIRIEDEVLVTADAPDVLTAALEKTPEAIEALVRAA
jgi:Xaa-Pro aminopeptidase